jgi:hypothetical protein
MMTLRELGGYGGGSNPGGLINARSLSELYGIGRPASPAYGEMPRAGSAASAHGAPPRSPDFSIANEGGSVDPRLAAALAARVAPGQGNVFDQFDAEPAPSSGGGMDPAANPMAAEKPSANPFDQFDEPQHGEAQPSVLEDVINSAGTGLARGAAGLVGLPGDLFKWVNADLDWAHDKLTGTKHPPTPMPDWLPTSENIRNVASDVTGVTLPEPKTQLGRYVETVGEFAPSALAGPGSLAGRLTKFAVAPGIASEAAGEATQGTPLEVPARLVASVAAGGIAHGLSRPSTAAQALRQQLPKGMTETDLSRASSFMQMAQSKGVSLTWPEALARVTKGRVDLTDLQRWLEQSTGGKPAMSDFMAKRPGQTQAAMDAELGGMTNAAGDPVAAGLRVQGQSNTALTRLRQRINSITQSLYKRGGQAQVHPGVMTAMMKDPIFADALKNVRADPVYGRLVTGMPDNSVAVFDAVKKRLDDLASTADRSGSNAAASVYGGVARDVRDAGRNASPEYGQALDRQSQLRRAVLDPAEAGPLGRMAGTPDLQQQGRVLLPANPVAGSERVVTQTVRRLANRDPNAALQLVGSHLADAFNEATRELTSGPNGFGAAKFVSKIMGNRQQEKNLQAAVLALPGGGVRWAGMKRLMEVFAATGVRQRPGSATEFNKLLTEKMTRGSGMGKAASVAASPGTMMTYVGDFYRQFRMGKNAEQLAKIITSPTSEPLFRKLLSAKTLTDRQRAAAVLIYDTFEGIQRKHAEPLKLSIGAPSPGYQ